jgi:hypothetical protein
MQLKTDKVDLKKHIEFFLHFFAIPSSSRHEKRCRMSKIILCPFQCSRNWGWNGNLKNACTHTHTLLKDIYSNSHCSCGTVIAHTWSYLFTRDEFKLKFSKLSRAELGRFRAEWSQAGVVQFLSWNQADSMYVNKKQIFSTFLELQSNFLILCLYHD